MYQVDEPLWLSVAEMYLEGPADRWYQSIMPNSKTPHGIASVVCFTTALIVTSMNFYFVSRSISIRKPVSAYVTEFSELVDQLNAYSQTSDPMYFTMHFIDGLKPKIKAIVLVQRPKMFNTACALALLREQVAGLVMAKPTRGGD